MRTLALLALALVMAGPVSAAGPQRAAGWIGIGFEVKSAETTVGGAPSTIVTEVRDGSPAAAAGILVGDRLLTINDVGTVEGFENLAERLALRVGDRVVIRLDRGGRRVELTLRAAERPSDFGMWTPEPDMPTDSMAEEMFRAIDSLRIQILATTRPTTPPQAPRAPQAPQSPRARFVTEPPEPREPPVRFDAPFEFFIFRSEHHDSLRLAMEDLNRRIESLRDQEQQLAERRRERTRARTETQTLDAQLTEIREAITEVTRESSTLRAAMAEAARETAAVEYFAPDPVDVPFRPLTPYLLGSNRVAGAEVVDIKPGLAEYFRVETGVLVVDVAPGTPAAIAGIQAGDVITSLDRVNVRTVDELRTGVSRAGDTLPVTLVRRGSTLEVLLRRM
ncbi:MAG: PDZ domain-containing protein [Longimicrobiales bacterium]